MLLVVALGSFKVTFKDRSSGKKVRENFASFSIIGERVPVGYLFDNQ